MKASCFGINFANLKQKEFISIILFFLFNIIIILILLLFLISQNNEIKYKKIYFK